MTLLGLATLGTIASFLLVGCLPLGKASGVLVPAETITLPLDGVRKLEAAMHDRIMDGIEFRETVCAMSKKPGSTVKLAARYCTDLDDRREGAVNAHRQARRLLDAPDLVQVDGRRVIDLMMRGIGAAVDAAK
jgi:hypothetical protein